jgi:hypothetical protein
LEEAGYDQNIRKVKGIKIRDGWTARNKTWKAETLIWNQNCKSTNGSQDLN